ncbi:TfuA-like protein [Burkholderia sp. Ac-20344]|uniref:TfuA-like protein n=1 Tax=Burkholderia sp. Ac-20344 TaxID=2703890 RepID=UPI00197C8257|nr:TfuA-like protein [Burkholderia sp. Ac-20344]MBN3831907.1 hypothetical protein [Burkholderia sp. Ac-20344]
MITSSRYNRLYIFAGPTASGSGVDMTSTESVQFRPPVRRGDIEKLIASNPEPANIAIVDGTYFTYPAVGHIEIRDALERGWTVWGISSMGAIRAFEMREHGMKGFGRVYNAFFQEDDLQDDEVALLHGDEPPYFALTEPLIHLRTFLSDMADTGRITTAAANSVCSQLKSLWFGRRTLALFSALLGAEPGGVRLSVDELRTALKPHRIKTLDFEDFMRERPWISLDIPVASAASALG